MSFTTFFMHIIFGNISILNSNSIIYIIPILSIIIISFTLKAILYSTPKLRRIKQ